MDYNNFGTMDDIDVTGDYTPQTVFNSTDTGNSPIRDPVLSSVNQTMSMQSPGLLDISENRPYSAPVNYSPDVNLQATPTSHFVGSHGTPMSPYMIRAPGAQLNHYRSQLAVAKNDLLTLHMENRRLRQENEDLKITIEGISKEKEDMAKTIEELQEKEEKRDTAEKTAFNVKTRDSLFNTDLQRIYDQLIHDDPNFGFNDDPIDSHHNELVRQRLYEYALKSTFEGFLPWMSEPKRRWMQKIRIFKQNRVKRASKDIAEPEGKIQRLKDDKRSRHIREKKVARLRAAEHMISAYDDAQFTAVANLREIASKEKIQSMLPFLANQDFHSSDEEVTEVTTLGNIKKKGFYKRRKIPWETETWATFKKACDLWYRQYLPGGPKSQLRSVYDGKDCPTSSRKIPVIGDGKTKVPSSICRFV